MSRTSLAPRSLLALLLLAGAFAPAAAESPIGSAFTFQGSLNESGAVANGVYDLRFLLFDAPTAGTQMGGTIDIGDLVVANGIFSVSLDFGSSWFLGGARWLQVEVRPGASTGAFSALGRQELTPTPFSIGLSLPHQQTYATGASVVQFSNTGSGNGGTFAAGGAALNYGVLGRNSGTGYQAAGVRGLADANSGVVIGVEGVATNSPAGTGLVGSGAATGAYISGTGGNSTGLYAYGYARGLYAENLGTGPAAYLTGKGQSAQNATLRVENTEPVAGMAAYAHNNSTYATAHLQNDASGQVLWLEHHGTGNYIVATSGSDYKFWVDNAGVTHTKVLEILGGADLSEKFDVLGNEADIAPGSVVSIDPDHEGRLAVCRTAYDHRVAGIVSGAGGVRPGMIMGQEGSPATGAHPVALTGRVYCRVTASNGPVRPGDLLTTSSVPGHAMRASDPAAARGAILGKAMGSLDRGEGLVLVLVGLQ